MLGLLLGLACGGVEFALLQAFTKRLVAGGSIPVSLVIFKFLALFIFFVPCALLAPQQLGVAGIAAAAALIISSIVKFIIQRRRDKAPGISGDVGGNAHE